MNKIDITTWYEIEMPDGESRKLKAHTQVQYDSVESLESVLAQHEEKVGTIERKLLNTNE